MATEGPEPPPMPHHMWRVVQTVAVLLVLAAFLFASRAVLNPVVLFLLLWAVMQPFHGRPGFVPLLAVAALTTVFWLLAGSGSLLAPFVLAAVLAYVLDPAVDALSRRGLSRSIAILLIIILALAALSGIVLVLVPAALRELGDVLESAPIFFERLNVWLARGESILRTIDLPLVDGAALAERLEAIDSDQVVVFLQERHEALLAYLWNGILGVGRGIGSFMTIFSYVVLTPVLTFYLIRDFDRITEVLTSLVPVNQREDVVSFTRECDRLVSSYLRGQLLVAMVIGSITAVGLAITRFPYAWSIGLLVGIFSVVPYLGLILSLVPAVFIALISGSVGASLLKVAGVFGVTQLLDGSVISPRIIGDSVGIHPVWVLLALSLGGYFFGVVGLLIAVPLAAVSKLLILRAVARYQQTSFYRGTEAESSG